MNCLNTTLPKFYNLDSIMADNICDDAIAQALTIAIQSGCTDEILEVLDWVKDHNMLLEIIKLR
jgi:hypothetical protein